MTRLYFFQEIYVVARRIHPKRKAPLQGRFIKSVFIADLNAPNALFTLGTPRSRSAWDSGYMKREGERRTLREEPHLNLDSWCPLHGNCGEDTSLPLYQVLSAEKWMDQNLVAFMYAIWG